MTPDTNGGWVGDSLQKVLHFHTLQISEGEKKGQWWGSQKSNKSFLDPNLP